MKSYYYQNKARDRQNTKIIVFVFFVIALAVGIFAGIDVSNEDGIIQGILKLLGET